MGGTFGCVGEPLSPLSAPEFLEKLCKILPIHMHIDCFEAFHIRDSSAATSEDWLLLTKQIQTLQQQDYQYFVVIHGTDTLTYAAATLSRFLQQSCHIIFTGSQYPLLHVSGNNTRDFTDALDNLNSALSYIYKVPAGVYVAFHHQVFHASSTIKIHSTELQAFHGDAVEITHDASKRKYSSHSIDTTETHTPPSININKPALVITNEHIEKAKALNILNLMMQPIAVDYLNQNLKLISTQTPDVLILQGYGTGNIAVDDHTIALLKDIQQQGCQVILDTQVTFGGLDQRYAISQWVNQSKLLINNAKSHSDLYAKILKMYLQYPSSDQWQAHWYDHSN